MPQVREEVDLANRLQYSTSPYLLQHKDNPVDWYPWGPEAFEEARRRGVPILLSVGYSSCHWCHVMAHESFEDPATAEIMNSRFVNVKVDREERPDVDEIYMNALQAMTGHGGWPMTVFLLPDGRPFFAGTYFPKEERGGLPSFKAVLLAISELYESNREEVEEQASKLASVLQPPRLVGTSEAGWDLAQGAFEALYAAFDDELGGFGGAPKFPQAPNLDYVLRYHWVTEDPRAERVLSKTLDAIALGGMHDHLAGGFFRYSVDRRWEIPHFEKMLYDNAQLIRIYLWAAQHLGFPTYSRIARETADFLIERMRDPAGGFYSAMDADTEGEEGGTYVFEYSELRSLLPEESFPIVCEYFGITEKGNFEGKNHLQATRPLEDLTEEERSAILEARRLLLEARDRRPQPDLDDKVLASWNGLAIHALADLSRATGKGKYLDAAVECARFLRESMTEEGSLRHSWRAGKVSDRTFSSDLASVASGALALFEATGDWEWVDHAVTLARLLLDHFVDEADGLVYLTPGGDESGAGSDGLIARPKPILDNAEPSPSSLSAMLFLRLGRLLGDASFEEAGKRIIESVAPLASRHPSAFGAWLSAFLFYLLPPAEIVASGPLSDAMKAQVFSSYLPNFVLVPGTTGAPEGLVILEGKIEEEGRGRVYVCSGYACEAPAFGTSQLRAAIQAAAVRQKRPAS